MTIPTSVLSATFYSHDGSPLPGVVITAQLSGTDIYNSQYVANKFFTATTGTNGAASLTLYTNSSGLRGTYYNVKAIYQGRVLSDSNVTLSASANLVDVEGNYDGNIVNPPPGNYSITGNLTVTGTLNAGATALSSLTLNTPLPIAQGGTGATTALGARINLELGSMSQQNADNVSITGGLIGGTTVVAVAGSTTASGVTNVPAGNIAATNVQAAINELDTEKQPVDPTLTSLSALGTAADKYAYTTGVDTWVEGAITAAGRALVANATAADQRTTLGVYSTAETDAAAVAMAIVF